MGILIKVGAVAAAVVAGLAVCAPAQAYNYATGECSDGDSLANFETAWRTASGYKSAVTYNAILTNENGLGNKSNVRARHYRNVSGGSDSLLDDMKSADNVRPNRYNTWSASSAARVRTNQTAHTRYDFAFDNSGPDDHCHADTEDF